MPERAVTVLGRPLPPADLFIVAGPCILEGEGMALTIAGELKRIARDLGLRLIFKASYRKDNRSSVESFTGLGDREGLDLLARVKRELDLPVLTDVHGLEEVEPAAEVCDVLQIPAFLSRQTRLIQAVARSRAIINVKKGQFLAPDDMARVVEKIRRAAPAKEVWLTERGTTFGYHNLVVDMRTFPVMRRQDAAVIFDVTHSLQHPGVGGDRGFALPLARAALAAGADGLFFETHPDPASALSDPTTQLPLAGVRGFLEEMVEWKRLHARLGPRGDAAAEGWGG
jgi:2-dehydro-3-deoxyphosphooctonate aldolase (KDO 8-P synthase)